MNFYYARKTETNRYLTIPSYDKRNRITEFDDNGKFVKIRESCQTPWKLKYIFGKFIYLLTIRNINGVHCMYGASLSSIFFLFDKRPKS